MIKKKQSKEKAETDINKVYDQDDFSEQMLRALVQYPEVYEQVLLRKIDPEDFVSGYLGYGAYKEVAAVLLSIKGVCDKDTFTMHYNAAKEDGKFKIYNEEAIDQLVEYMFTPPASSQEEYMLEHINGFLLRRRLLKASVENAEDLNAMQAKFSLIADDLHAVEVSRTAVSMDPFEKCMPTSRTSGIPTGIPGIDDKTNGLGRGECALLIGHSGTGKTAISSYIMREAAIAGYNALYITAEEPMDNITHRWYAQQFSIPYTEMYQGLKEPEKREAFAKMSASTKKKLSRLKISDVRAVYPLNAKSIKTVIEDFAAKGFIADVVLIDQMDYLSPIRPVGKDEAKWQQYSTVAFDLDQLSHHKIGGVHEFALWVVHQATGDMQWRYTYNEISGFRGIVKPFDLAVGVGREDRQATHINLFSLKVRHSEHFEAAQLAQFEYMRVTEDAGYKTKEVREKEAKKASALKGKTTRSKKNPIDDQVNGD